MLRVITCAIFISWCVIYTGCQNEVGYGPPRLLYETSDSKQVNAEDSFKLECESDRAISWIYPKLTISPDMYEEVNYETSDHISYSKTTTGQYQSVLSLTSVNFLDTGTYSCILNGTSPEEADNSASIYVYVKDSINLLVRNDSFIVLPVIQYQAAVIPCRPTSPEVNMTLMREGSEVHLGIQESDQMNVTYDPKIGFILNPINIKDTGLFECVATMGDEEDKLHCHMDVLKVSTSIPKPSINDSAVHPVVAGGSLYLECVGMATRGIKFSFRWFGPNKDTIKDSRTSIAVPLPYKKCGKDTYVCHMSSLTIRDVRMSDAGNYTCLVVDHNGITNNDTQEIKIHEPGMDYINLTHDGLDFNVPANRPNVTWMIRVDAFSAPTTLWLNQQEVEINTENNNKYKQIKSKGFQQVMLVIYDVQVQDAGTYLFVASNGNVTSTLNLTLTVREKPTVNIEDGGEIYHQLGRNYTMQCKVVGYPAPNLKWSFSNCDLLSDCNEAKFQTIKDVSELELEKRAFQYISTFVWTVTKPGLLKCYADNTEGNGSDVMSIFVTDIPDEQGLSIWGKPDKVVVGDTITLTCGATKYNYSDDISWYERRIGYQTKYPIENKTDEQYVMRNDTLYSYRAELTLLNLKLGSDANYTCEVKRSEDGVPETREQVVNVLSPKEPKIVSTNLNTTEMSVNTGSRVIMYCRADGLPVPTVKWYKDNNLLHNNTRMFIGKDQLTIPFAKLEDEGDYRCDVMNRLKTVSRSISLKFKDKPGVNLFLVIAIIVCVIFLVIMIIVLIAKIYKERMLRKELDVAGLSNFVQGAMENINPELPVDDQAELLPYDKKWEFPRDKLKLGKQLGSGAFGVVMKGEAWGVIDGELKSTVAVKMVKRNADRTYIKALASELKIMIHLGKHLNVVNLLGACTKNLAKMELLVIVEYCRFGNLHNYLLRHREEFVDQIDPRSGEIDTTIGTEILSRTESFRSNSKLKYASLSFSNSSGAKSDSGGMHVDYRAACPTDPGNRTSDSLGMDTEMNLISLTPTGEHDEFILSNNSSQPEWRSNYRGDYKGARPICTHDLLCWAFQVARGMEYLASRKVLHGDLAARNILLADDNVVKICDFGLAKSMYKSDNYHKKGDGPLPVKWMAVESIRDRVFSTQSDVWSFGIVLWEFFSLARTPYPGMEADEKLYNKLAGGYRMERPQYSTADIYSVMMKCWEARPVNRPSFFDLTQRLGSMLEESVRRHYIDLNDPYMDMNTLWLQGLENDYLSMMNAPTYGNMVSPSRVDDDDDREYVNGPHQAEATSDGGESSGYLCMKSPTPEDVIFSPRRKETNIFRFSPHLQNQRRIKNEEAEGAQKPEHKPMLSTTRNSESDIELDEMEKGSSNKEEEKQSERTKDTDKPELPGFSNPSYQSVIPILPSDDNYVNMPQQKKSKYDKLRNISESLSTNTEYSDCFPSPTEMTTGEQSKYQNSFSNPNYQSQIKSQDAYVNVPNHGRRISDASSGFQSDVGESLLVN